MASCILHRALSFSNVPTDRRDLLSSQEASGVSGRPEGLALLTTISEGGGSCSRSSPLVNHSLLEKKLVSKILRLREALDLPCQGSCDPLDELLCDTLEALKIAYPKCLSGLSGPRTSSVQQALVDLHMVLRSVLDCHDEHKQMHSEKHTIAESQSLVEIGEHAIKMLDQVTPIAKEKFSSMESSKGPNAAGAAWSEDLQESRTLPPVLCRPRSPSHRKHVGDHQSDKAVIAIPTSLMEETKIQKAPRQDAAESDFIGKHGQAFRCEPPPTPAGDCLLQTTPSSMSPHPLSAPPPSPVPIMGLPMLLQPWEVMQDDNATAARSPPPTAQSDQAASTANQNATLTIGSENKSSRASSVSMDSHENTQPLVQELSLPVRNALPPPTPSPSQIAAKAPPPPPPGNISAVLHAKRAASKLKRSTQMGSLYRHLRDRVEGSDCTHGGKKRQGKKAKAPAGTKGDAGQGMADALAEMTKRSAYFRQIEEDAENHAATILELKDDIDSFQSKDMAEVARFHQHVEQQLVCLTDETQVLSRFEGFPSKKLESLRMAAALYSKLDGAVSTLKGWKLATPLSQQLDKIEGYFNKIKDDVDMIERNKDEEMKRFHSHGIHFDFGVLVRIKECMVDLSSNCMELALKECQDAKVAAAESTRATSLSRMLWRVFQLAFRVYNFAGGQDDRADRLTSILALEIEAHPL
ncbi:hypothetical protein EJB05_19310 [Eragrostis curvula]|uniref:Hydroxyproline-rich glycoprotein family protein n=1 Tax=Eragrostis curvula TaxID=38414 RepID=A0A5J9UV99_9POAL|nr:hypothetical protein EJB05_19310 [Eragrostis curvula]